MKRLRKFIFDYSSSKEQEEDDDYLKMDVSIINIKGFHKKKLYRGGGGSAPLGKHSSMALWMTGGSVGTLA
jgi:hypothetical protein